MKEKQDLVDKISKVDADKIQQYITYQKQVDSLCLKNINVKMSKKQHTKFNTMDQKVLDSYTTLQTRLQYVTHEIEKTCHSQQIDNLMSLLDHFEYISKKDNKVLLKGLLASYINDCNLFLLIECFVQKLFHSLTAVEIVGFLSIFVESNNNECNDKCKLHTLLTTVISIVEEYNKIEVKYGIEYKEDFWSINSDFVDIAKTHRNIYFHPETPIEKIESFIGEIIDQQPCCR